MTRLSMMTVILSGAVTLASGCAHGDSGGPAPAPSPTTAPATAPASPVPTGNTASPGSPAPVTTHPSWTSGPVTVVHHPPVPPVPLVTGVHYAAHSREGFDRIVFDIRGSVPGYSVRYVSEVRADPSDDVVPVPGRAYLLVVLTPAQAHRDDGTATVSGVHRLGLPMLRSYAIVGDFEGYVTIAVGLDDVVGYRVGELPGRIYLDVAA